MTHAERVFSQLSTHRGRDSAISAPRLCRRLRWSPGLERQVRSIIEQNANSAWPGVLCAVPGSGYFFAEDLSEIITYRAYLLSLKNAAVSKLAIFDAQAKREGFHLQEEP